MAQKDGRILPQHVPLIEMLPEARPRSGFFEQEEFERVLAHLPEWFQGPVTVGYWTGMRRTEILELTWDRVDLFEGLVFLEETKNGEPRILPLNDELREVFRREATRRWEDSPLVFHRLGMPVGDARRTWWKACVAAGVGRWIEADGKRAYSGRLFHDLRRTGVRNLIRAGVPTSVAMEISGHKTHSVFQRYNISDLTDRRVAMTKYSELEKLKRQQRLERDAALAAVEPAKPAARIQ